MGARLLNPGLTRQAKKQIHIKLNIARTYDRQRKTVIRACLFAGVGALVTVTSCTTPVWVNPEKGPDSYNRDYLDCVDQAAEKTGSYDESRVFDAAFEKCFGEKGWKKQRDFAVW